MIIKPHTLALALFVASAPLLADVAQANAALQHGRVGEAEQMLRANLKTSPNEPRAHQLLCRVFYAQDQPDHAVPECEAAVAAQPNDSDNQLWLGRAYGQKAENANYYTAYTLARKVRAAFERAVQLQPASPDAFNSLAQFYIDAPAIVGGGLDKARHLADALQPRSPAQSHRIRGLIAVSTKDLRTAESEFKAAVAAVLTPEAFIDLALFYQTHNQPDQALAAARAAIAADRARGPSLVDAASILHDANRAPDLAERALRDYLDSPAQTDAAPVFKAHLQLGRLLAQRGDAAGARREYAAALALAPNFAPARDAMAQNTAKGA